MVRRDDNELTIGATVAERGKLHEHFSHWCDRAALPRRGGWNYTVGNALSLGPQALLGAVMVRRAERRDWDLMINLGKMGSRSPVLMLLAAVWLMLDVNSAYAQAAIQCQRLQGMLSQFDQNGAFQQVGGDSRAARQAQRDVQAMESRYIRDGCNDDARAGRTLSRQCSQIGQEVLRLREVAAQVGQQVDTANAVAGQREAILQEMARFGCREGSNASFSTERQSVFDRIFGTTTEGDFTDGQMIDGGGYFGNSGYQTIRTVCVRISDGYFWPISYSTLPDYVSQDAQVCSASCPTTPVALYYYNNPGEEPEQMRNVFGEPYTALPSAFAYRDAVDTSATCKVAPQSSGSFRTATLGDGSTRSIIEVNGVDIPLPLRDPRGQAPIEAPINAPLQTANLVNVPLPRVRPAGPGETPITRPVNQTAEQNQLRLVQFGDRVVRVVGPDTPYAQPAEEGT